MIQIRREAEDIITGKQPKDNNVLKNAPHPLSVIVLPENEWKRWVFAYVSHCMLNVYSPLVHIPAKRLHTLSPGFSKGSFGQLSPG